MSSSKKVSVDVELIHEIMKDPGRRKSVTVDTVPLASEGKAPGFKELMKHKRVVAWCLMIYILPINFGYEAGSIGNILAIPAFLRRFGTPLPGGLYEISSYDQQILTASLIIGLFLAAIITGFVSDILGRKWTIVVACLTCITGVLVQGFTQSIPMLFGGKLVSTIGFGIGVSTSPVYVAEIAPVELRGICLTLVNGMIVVGSWACALVGYGTSHIQSDWAWRLLILSQLVPPALMLILAALVLPESPSWLVMKGKPGKAAQSFRKFNGPIFDAETAVTLIEAAVQKEKALEAESFSYLDCFRGTNRRRTFLVCSLFVAQQCSGSFFVAGYLPYFFTIVGVANPIGISQISYSIQLLGNICSWFVVDRLGRRPLAVGGTIIMTATLLIIGGLGCVKNNKAALTAVVAFMSFWGFLYQLTLGPVAYAVSGETASTRARQKTFSLGLIANTLSGLVVVEVMPLLINPTNANLGAKVTFIFFALSVPMCVYLFFCFPEMKGRSYLELDEMFQNKVPARKFKSYKCEIKIISEPQGEKIVSVEHDEVSV